MPIYLLQLSSSLRKAFLFLLLSGFLPLYSLTPGEELTTVTVQFEMNRDMIFSERAYESAVRKAVEAAMAEGPADLLIFPEYLGVFASLIPWNSYLLEDKPFEQVWQDIIRDRPALTSLKDLFSSGSSDTEDFLDSLWGSLSREYSVYILGGTRFYYDTEKRGVFNQAVVYSPEGRVLYSQYKYFLTEFEEDILGLSAGDIKDADGFRVKDHHIRLTICRDTFLREWEEVNRTGELWIDIKANGTAYTSDQVSLFSRALPARLIQTEIPYGITACLTGVFLDLLWEGESSIIYNDNKESIICLAKTESYDRFEILRNTIP